MKKLSTMLIIIMLLLTNLNVFALDLSNVTDIQAKLDEELASLDVELDISRSSMKNNNLYNAVYWPLREKYPEYENVIKHTCESDKCEYFLEYYEGNTNYKTSTKEMKITPYGMNFGESTISLEVGETKSFTINNPDNLDYYIDTFGTEEIISVDEEAQTVTALKPGFAEIDLYEYKSNFSEHHDFIRIIIEPEKYINQLMAELEESLEVEYYDYHTETDYKELISNYVRRKISDIPYDEYDIQNESATSTTASYDFTITYDDKTYTADVNNVPIKITGTGIFVDGDNSYEMEIGETKQLKIYVYKDGELVDYTTESTNPEVAIIDNTGFLQAKENGYTRISIQGEDSANYINIFVGTTADGLLEEIKTKIEKEIFYLDHYSIDNIGSESVISNKISEYLRKNNYSGFYSHSIKKVSEGKYTGKITCVNKSIDIEITTKNEGIKLNKKKMELAVGNSYQISIPNLNTEELDGYLLSDIEFESFDEKVATVSSSGKIIPRQKGYTTIQIRTKDRKYYNVIRIYVDIEKYLKEKYQTLSIDNDRYYYYGDLSRYISSDLMSMLNDYDYENTKVSNVSEKDNKASFTLEFKIEQKHTIKFTDVPISYYGYHLELERYSNNTIGVGDTKQIKVVAGDINSIERWYSSDESIATVTQDGTITGVKAGWVDVGVIDKKGNFYSISIHVQLSKQEAIDEIKGTLDKIDDKIEIKYVEEMTEETKLKYIVSKLYELYNIDIHNIDSYITYNHIDGDTYAIYFIDSYYDIEEAKVVDIVFTKVNPTDYKDVKEYIEGLSMLDNPITIPWDYKIIESYKDRTYGYSRINYLNDIISTKGLKALHTYAEMGGTVDPESTSTIYGSGFVFEKNGIYYTDGDIMFLETNKIVVPSTTKTDEASLIAAAKEVFSKLINVSATDVQVTKAPHHQGNQTFYDFVYGNYTTTLYIEVNKESGQAGFKQIDGKTYYFDSDGNMVTGWADIENNRYYFNLNGEMQKGIVEVEGKKYFLNKTNGQLLKGWIESDNSKYYSDADGVLASGITTIGDKEYFFGLTKNKLMYGLITSGDKLYYTNSKGILQTGMLNVNDKWYYFNEATDENAYEAGSGIKEIDGLKYYFDPETKERAAGITTIGEDKYFFGITKGKMMLGWINWNGNKYYTDPVSGILASRVTVVEGKPYFFGIKSNRLMYGLIHDTEQNKLYYTNSEGILQTGMQNVNGTWYYFNEETYEAEGGEKTIDGLDYYFDPETKVRASGITEIDGQEYFYGITKGKKMLGWINWNGNKYYTDPVSGVLASRVTVVEGKPYFFGIKSNRLMYGLIHDTEQNKLYYTNSEGILQTGMQNVNGTWYYFNEETYEAEGGEKTIDGLEYYFDPETKVRASGITEIDGQEYFYGITKGKKMLGWINWNGNKYYTDPVSGILASRVTVVEGKPYFFGIKSNRLMYGLIHDTEQNKLYYTNSEGILQTGMQNINGTWYYFNEETYEAEGGEKTIDGLDYYFDPETKVRASGITEIDGQEYFYGITKGKKMFGWINWNGNKYYTDPVSGILASGVTVVEGKPYFFGINTNRVMYGLISYDGKYYYTNSEGILQTGKKVINGRTYNFDPETYASN